MQYQQLRKEISSGVKIVVAVKGRIEQEVMDVIEQGATDLGENYVQEAEKLFERLGNIAKNVKWHLIGHLQSNKIKRALKIFDVIQTVDSYEKARKINNLAKKKVEIYLQLNIADEKNKQGFSFDENFEEIINKIKKLPNLNLTGLMVMGKKGQEKEDFRKAKKIFEQTNLKILSMGMSDSYHLAIKEGSNLVRLGTIIFGKRK